MSVDDTIVPIASPDVGDGERDRIEEVIAAGELADGPTVRAFEREFADYCGARHAVATSNGTTALHAALRALGIGPGDAVVTTPFSFVATANAIRLCGAEPVFADIDLDTYGLYPPSVERAIREYDGDVDAILAVHLYGLPAAMDRLEEIADEHDLLLVEDAAQAHGATFDGEHVGTIGDAGCFSFYPTKNMTTGEGGMIVTDRADVAERAARFVNHGRTGANEHETVGHNFRMSGVAAAIGRSQLEKLPRYVERRRENARRYTSILSDTRVVPPTVPPDRTHAYNQYTVRYEDRERLRDALAHIGVDSRVYYPSTIPQQPAYGDDVAVPRAERAADHALSLPVHPNVSTPEIRWIANEVAHHVEESYDRIRF